MAHNILPFAWQYDDVTGAKTHIWVFSALDTTCTTQAVQDAFDDGQISQQYKDAILANTYGGDTPPQPEDWVAIV